jgi:adenylate kinase family enzyme
MPTILSLQGCMAVGKTTVCRHLQISAPYVHVSYERHNNIVALIKQRGLNKNEYEDYLEIQTMWLKNEVERWKEAQDYKCTVMDFGAEEIEFYTLNYPRTINAEWELESRLHSELEELRKCFPNRILFLNASTNTLREHKEKDNTRPRNFFEHHLQHLLPLKQKWFIGRSDTDILDVDLLSEDEVAEKVKQWVDMCITTYC